MCYNSDGNDTEKEVYNIMVEVVAALIWDGDKFLICRRPESKTRGLLWEFAGGKVESGETKRAALVRECREELDITVSVENVFTEVVHKYPDIDIHLTLFNCKIQEGTPKLIEHCEIRWISAAETELYEFCPADKVILQKLKEAEAAYETEERFSISHVPAVLYGSGNNRAVYLFVHGKCGCKEEAKAFARNVCRKGYDVLGIDLAEHGERKQESGMFDPFHIVPELLTVMEYIKQRWAHVSLRANSIGAMFCMMAFANERIEKCLFVSPLLDMEKLIMGMMQAENVSEERLEREKLIPTHFGETLSWEYLLYVRANKTKRWSIPTEILYGTLDNMTDMTTVEEFCNTFGAKLSVMQDGEHWFHTPEQLEFLKKWELGG